MDEFQGMDDNAIVLAHSLYELADRFPPRPAMVQTGYNDQRVGQDWIDRAVHRISDAYRAAGSGHRFTHDLMDIPGHDGTRIPTSALDSVVTLDARTAARLGPTRMQRRRPLDRGRQEELAVMKSRQYVQEHGIR